MTGFQTIVSKDYGLISAYIIGIVFFMSVQIFGIQTLGGTGALAMGSTFLTTASRRSVIYTSDLGFGWLISMFYSFLSPHS